MDSATVPEMLWNRCITFAGKFEPVRHRCRAPRPDGRLCERQDRLKVRWRPGPGWLPQGSAGPGQDGQMECWAPAGRRKARRGLQLGPPSQGGLVRGWQASCRRQESDIWDLGGSALVPASLLSTAPPEPEMG